MIKTRQDINQFINQHSDQLAQQVMQRSQRWYEKLEDAAEQEFLIPATERQINEALQNFVVKNAIEALSFAPRTHFQNILMTRRSPATSVSTSSRVL